MFSQSQSDGIDILPEVTVDFASEFVASGPASALKLEIRWTGAVDSEVLSAEIAGLLTAISEREKALGGTGMVAHSEECFHSSHADRHTLTVLLRPCDARWSTKRCDQLADELARLTLPRGGSPDEELHATIRRALPLFVGRTSGHGNEPLNWTARRIAA